MQRILSTYLFVNHKLTTHSLSEIEHAGFGAVEIFGNPSHFDYRERPVVRELADWFTGHPLKVHAMHAPTSRELAPARESGIPISIADPERVRRLEAVDEVKRTLEVAERIPFHILVLHLSGARETLDPRKTNAAFNSLEHLVVFAKQRGVTIALENIPGELTSPSSLRHLIEDTRLADLRLCFDIGHAHMEDGVAPSYETMRDLVITTHLHDNHGEKDEHLLPFEGTIQWDNALRMLAEAPAAPGGLPLVLELKESATPATPAQQLERAAAAFERFEKAKTAKT